MRAVRRDSLLGLTVWIGLVSIAVALAACSAPSSPSGGSSPDGQLNCERDAYPCTYEEVDQAIREVESSYIQSIEAMLDTGTFAEAVAWIRSQPFVVDADADASTLYFRLEGSRPIFVLDRALESESVSATLSMTVQDGVGHVGVAPIGPSGIVGEGTSRANPRNRKRAKLLEPFAWERGLAGPRWESWKAKFRQIHDYNHELEDVVHRYDEEVDPAEFADFSAYDFVLIDTHGGQFSKTTWLGTGLVQKYNPPIDSFDRVCADLMLNFERTEGAECGIVRTFQGSYVVLGLLADYFIHAYGQHGGLEKSVIVVSACVSLTDNWDLAEALAGSTSAYFGWDDLIVGPIGVRSIEELLNQLVILRKPAGTAYDTVCAKGLCGGGQGAQLKLYNNGQEPRELRLSDLPVLKDPANPTATNPLEDGASLRIRGNPGDGSHDGLEFVVDVTGVIDPSDTGGGVGTSQAASPAGLYNVAFYVDDQHVGFANLGEEESARATVAQLDDVTYRMTYLADLPFDVADEGTDVTLKVEVSLPEGGISDFEVDVTLRGVGCEFHAVVTGFNQADISARTTRLTEIADYYEHGTADAILADDGSSGLVAFSFDGPLLGEDFTGWISRGSRSPIPEGATGTFDMVGSASVGGEAQHFDVISGPLWWEPDSQPLQLTVTSFSEGVVTGTIAGNVWDIDENDPPPSFLSIEFTAMTKVGSTTPSSCDTN